MHSEESDPAHLVHGPPQVLRVASASRRLRPGRDWRVLRVLSRLDRDTLPGSESLLGKKFELRRHDYSIKIAGGFAAAQLMLEYAEANRRAYTRGPYRRPIPDMLMVSIDISDVAFS